MPTQYYNRNGVTFGINSPDGSQPSESDLDTVFAQASHDIGQQHTNAALSAAAANAPGGPVPTVTDPVTGNVNLAPQIRAMGTGQTQVYGQQQADQASQAASALDRSQQLGMFDPVGSATRAMQLSPNTPSPTILRQQVAARQAEINRSQEGKQPEGLDDYIGGPFSQLWKYPQAAQDIVTSGNPSMPGSIVNNPIWQGVAQHALPMASPVGLAMLAALPAAGEVAGISNLLGKAFLAQGAVGTAQAAANTDLLHSNPGQYYGALGFNAAMGLGIPAALHGAGIMDAYRNRTPTLMNPDILGVDDFSGANARYANPQYAPQQPQLPPGSPPPNFPQIPAELPTEYAPAPPQRTSQNGYPSSYEPYTEPEVPPYTGFKRLPSPVVSTPPTVYGQQPISLPGETVPVPMSGELPQVAPNNHLIDLPPGFQGQQPDLDTGFKATHMIGDTPVMLDQSTGRNQYFDLDGRRIPVKGSKAVPIEGPPASSLPDIGRAPTNPDALNVASGPDLTQVNRQAELNLTPEGPKVQPDFGAAPTRPVEEPAAVPTVANPQYTIDFSDPHTAEIHSDVMQAASGTDATPQEMALATNQIKGIEDGNGISPSSRGSGEPASRPSDGNQASTQGIATEPTSGPEPAVTRSVDNEPAPERPVAITEPAANPVAAQEGEKGPVIPAGGGADGKIATTVTTEQAQKLANYLPQDSDLQEHIFQNWQDSKASGRKTVDLQLSRDDIATLKANSRDPALGKRLTNADVKLAKNLSTLNVGINPAAIGDALDVAREKLAPISDAIRNLKLEGGSFLRRTAPESDLAAARYSASANHANELTRQLVPKVLAHGDENAQARFQTFLTADRAAQQRVMSDREISANQAQFKRTVQDVMDMQKNARADAKDQSLTPQERALRARQWETAIKERQATAADLNRQIKSRRAEVDNNFLTKNEADIPTDMVDPVTKRPITENMTRAFFQDPQVQDMVAAHKQLIEPLMEKNYLETKSALGDKGRYSGVYQPAVALNEDGTPLRSLASSGGGMRSPIADIPNTPGAREFTGTGNNYATDYKDVVNRQLIAGNRVANFARLVRQTEADGLLQRSDVEQVDPATGQTTYVPNPNLRVVEVPDARGGKPIMRNEINVNGQWHPASSEFNLQDETWGLGGKRIGEKYPDLPAKAVMEANAWNEIHPMLSTRNASTRTTDVASAIGGKAIGLNLAGLGEGASHGVRGSSVVSKIVPTFGHADTASGKLQTGALEFANSVSTAFRQVGKMSGIGRDALPEQEMALQKAAQNGALPSNIDLKSKPGDTPIQKVTKLGGQIIYDPKRGSLVTALTEINNAYRDMATRAGTQIDNPDAPNYDKELDRKAIYAMRNMNTYIPYLQSGISKALGKDPTGLFGTFYQTGARNRAAGYIGGPAQFMARFAGYVGAAILAFKATSEDHKWPTEVPGYTLGDIRTGYDANGLPIYFNFFKAFDRTEGYNAQLAQSLMKDISEGASAASAAQGLGLMEVNNQLEPLTSGPGLPTVSDFFARKLPLLTRDEDKGGFNLMPSPTASPKNSTFGLHRMAAMAAHVTPLANAMGAGDYNATSTAPQSKTPRILNDLLRVGGQPQIHTYIPRSSYYMQKTNEINAK